MAGGGVDWIAASGSVGQYVLCGLGFEEDEDESRESNGGWRQRGSVGGRLLWRDGVSGRLRRLGSSVWARTG